MIGRDEIEPTAARVTAELLRLGFGTDERVSIIIEPVEGIGPMGQKSRVCVIVAGLAEGDIGARIEQAQPKVEPNLTEAICRRFAPPGPLAWRRPDPAAFISGRNSAPGSGAPAAAVCSAMGLATTLISGRCAPARVRPEPVGRHSSTTPRSDGAERKPNGGRRASEEKSGHATVLLAGTPARAWPATRKPRTARYRRAPRPDRHV